MVLRYYAIHDWLRLGNDKRMTYLFTFIIGLLRTKIASIIAIKNYYMVLTHIAYTRSDLLIELMEAVLSKIYIVPCPIGTRSKHQSLCSRGLTLGGFIVISYFTRFR